VVQAAAKLVPEPIFDGRKHPFEQDLGAYPPR
jgi:hypothetical protein